LKKRWTLYIVEEYCLNDVVKCGGMPKKETGFRGTSLKTELVNDIEQFIKDYPEAGFKSISDFVQEAVRVHIRETKSKYVSKHSST